MRGVTAAHKLLHCGVNCSLSTNNVLNPFTPFGDCSLIRMANLYANICTGRCARRHARVLQHDHGALRQADAAEGLRHRGRQGPADLLVFDCESAGEPRWREVVSPLYGFKRGRQTFTRPAAELHRPAMSAAPAITRSIRSGAFMSRQRTSRCKGSGRGPLAGLTFGVKDLFHIAGPSHRLRQSGLAAHASSRDRNGRCRCSGCSMPART